MSRLTSAQYQALRDRKNAKAIQDNRKALRRGPVSPKQSVQPSVVIGIDPSARTSGTGVCVINGRYVSFAPNMPNLDAVLQWLEHEAPNPARVVIENSNLQNTSFIMQGSKAAVAKIARNVGRNQEASQAIVDAARRIFGEQSVTEISPKQKGSKWCQKTADGVAQSLGHTLPKRMSQDKRDAYMLAVRKVK